MLLITCLSKMAVDTYNQGPNPPVRSHHAILVLTSTIIHAAVHECTGVKENQKPKSMTGT